MALEVATQASDYFGRELGLGAHVVIPWDHGDALGFKRGMIIAIPANGQVTVDLIGVPGQADEVLLLGEQVIRYKVVGVD